jgi:hypothetical protein
LYQKLMWMLHKAKPLLFVHVAVAAKKGEVRGLSPILFISAAAVPAG